uniref:Lipoprotein n=1 Tax=Rhizophora mucronata TaxID=61149 RepID=A0A2P2KDR6_RHIMU
MYNFRIKFGFSSVFFFFLLFGCLFLGAF